MIRVELMKVSIGPIAFPNKQWVRLVELTKPAPMTGVSVPPK
jgi:hypothetical protein